MFIPEVIDDDRRDLSSALADFISAHRRSGIEAVDFDESLWSSLSDQFGLEGLLIPEECGGTGLGVQELVAVQRELGRVLVPVPFFSTGVLACTMLLELPSSTARALIDRIVAGAIASVACWGEAGRWEDVGRSVNATDVSGSWVLDGESWYVTDAEQAEFVCVVATTAEGRAVFAVELDTPDVELIPLVTLDLTRPQTLLRLRSASATLLGDPGQSVAAIDRTLAVGVLALAAEQVGGAEAVMTMALDYTKTRVQFDRPIGGFQAIKHKLSDMALDLERMIAALEALTSAIEARQDSTHLVHLCKAFCSEAYFRLAAESIQIHGGIGFTWEFPAHLYFRRAKAAELYFGASSEHRDLMLRAINV